MPPGRQAENRAIVAGPTADADADNDDGRKRGKPRLADAVFRASSD
jgi:hypothetical protein